MKWLYFGGHGTLDLVAETYACLIKKRGGPLLFYANGSKTADLIFRPDVSSLRFASLKVKSNSEK